LKWVGGGLSKNREKASKDIKIIEKE